MDLSGANMAPATRLPRLAHLGARAGLVKPVLASYPP